MENSLKVLTMRISDLLLQSGVKRSDTAVVHCALSSSDWDMEALLQELTEFFAPGTLVMPVGHDENSAVPGGIFDPLQTPSGEDALSEMFRQLPDVVRSRHPAGSLAALGSDSSWLMADHEKSISEFSASSPWWKLFQKGVKCIFIGCGLERSCLIAAAEEWAGCARLSKRYYRRRLALGNGRNRRLRIKLHTGRHCRHYPKVEELLRDAGLLLRNRWDCCDVLVLNGSESVSLLLRILRRKPALFASGRTVRNLKIF